MTSARPTDRGGITLALLLVALAAPAAAQPPGDGERRVMQVVHLQNQPAEEALFLVLPLLSPDGTVELSPGGRTLVIRDRVSVVARVLPILRSYDHPAREIEVALWLVQGEVAHVSPVGPSEPGSLPPSVLAELYEHLPYQTYRLVSESQVTGREGEQVRFEVDGYRVSFRLGTVLAGRRLRLHHFELERVESEPGRRLLPRSNLNLVLDGTQVVALASGPESATVLLVILRTRQVGIAGGTEEP